MKHKERQKIDWNNLNDVIFVPQKRSYIGIYIFLLLLFALIAGVAMFFMNQKPVLEGVEMVCSGQDRMFPNIINRNIKGQVSNLTLKEIKDTKIEVEFYNSDSQRRWWEWVILGDSIQPLEVKNFILPMKAPCFETTAAVQWRIHSYK
jgi:ABC-type microcin C transport system permease subunit YejE